MMQSNFRVLSVRILEVKEGYVRANVSYFKGTVNNVVPASLAGMRLVLPRAFLNEERAIIQREIVNAVGRLG
jgi:hypothetical protein